MHSQGHIKPTLLVDSDSFCVEDTSLVLKVSLKILDYTEFSVILW